MFRNIRDFIQPKYKIYKVGLNKKSVIDKLNNIRQDFSSDYDVTVNFITADSFILDIKGGFSFKALGSFSKLLGRIESSDNDNTIIKVIVRPALSTYILFGASLLLPVFVLLVNIFYGGIGRFSWKVLPVLIFSLSIVGIFIARKDALEERLKNILKGKI